MAPANLLYIEVYKDFGLDRPERNGRHHGMEHKPQPTMQRPT